MPSDVKLKWGAPLAAGLVTLGLAGLVWVTVDLTPRVEADFFFSPEDPQLQESQALEDRFPSGELLIVRAAAADTESEEYQTRIAALADVLGNVPGVTSVYSVASENRGSPLWSRILTPGGPSDPATNVVLQIDDGTNGEDLTRRLEAAVELHQAPDFQIVASGVPVIVELIRRSLRHDLILFSTVALLLFGAITTVAYRDPRIVGGTIAACLTACSATLLITSAVGIGVGLLTANIITIVFVLTLSHTVFITANWRKQWEANEEIQGAAATAARETLRPSIWCMVTTVLGFSSLLLTSAEPLRELGTAGAIGTVVALMCAFTILPAFLAGAAPVANRYLARESIPLAFPLLGRRHLVAGGGLVLLLALGILRLDTDPTLLSYFNADGPIRPGLESIDASGGSAPLLIGVADAAGGALDTNDAYDRMWIMQDSLEADPSTGMVLSPAPLIAHAREQPLASFLPIPILLTFLDRPEFGGITQGFITADRSEALFSVRMLEGSRTTDREEVIARLVSHAAPAGLRVTSIGGLYELQGRLGALIASSLAIGLGGLLTLFFLIGFVVSGRARTALAMLLCLLSIPALVLGAFGHLGLAVDIITSPAANVALAMGVDATIHLVHRVRSLAELPAGEVSNWVRARDELATPIIAACSIICVGFGIFTLSDFPPTQRFGFAVILGTVSAAAAALVILPSVMGGTRSAAEY